MKVRLLRYTFAVFEFLKPSILSHPFFYRMVIYHETGCFK